MNALSPEKRAAFEAAIAKVRGRFLDLLGDRITGIEDSLADILASGASEHSIREIGAILHTIAGTARTVGFADLGAQVSDLDLRIDHGLKTGSPDTTWTDIASDLDAALENMRNVLASS